MGVPQTDPLSVLSLPPGFRFYPTDEELLVQYLCRKVAGHHFSLQIIGDIDLYKFDPWDLPSKAMFGEKEWYFFSPRDRKYPNGSRPNRVAGSGYWKATGTDKIITTEGRKVGIKKALVFYIGKAPKGTKTNWIMHEYRVFEPQRKNGSARLDEWVLCRIYKKNSSAQKPVMGISSSKEHSHSHSHSHGSSSSSSSQFDDVMESLPEIDDRFFTLPGMNSLNLGSGNFDWASLAGLNSMPEQFPGGGQAPMQTQAQGVIMQQNNNNNNQNDAYAPTMSPLGHVDTRFGRNIEEEVESGVRNQLNSNNYAPRDFTNSVDPFAIRYPTQPGNLGFRQ